MSPIEGNILRNIGWSILLLVSLSFSKKYFGGLWRYVLYVRLETSNMKLTDD